MPLVPIVSNAWQRACEWDAVRFLRAMPVGQRPQRLWLPVVDPPAGDPTTVDAWFEAEGREALEAAAGLGLAGPRSNPNSLAAPAR